MGRTLCELIQGGNCPCSQIFAAPGKTPVVCGQGSLKAMLAAANAICSTLAMAVNRAGAVDDRLDVVS
jgi:hypothetical protein